MTSGAQPIEQLIAKRMGSIQDGVDLKEYVRWVLLSPEMLEFFAGVPQRDFDKVFSVVRDPLVTLFLHKEPGRIGAIIDASAAVLKGRLYLDEFRFRTLRSRTESLDKLARMCNNEFGGIRSPIDWMESSDRAVAEIVNQMSGALRRRGATREIRRRAIVKFLEMCCYDDAGVPTGEVADFFG